MTNWVAQNKCIHYLTVFVAYLGLLFRISPGWMLVLPGVVGLSKAWPGSLRLSAEFPRSLRTSEIPVFLTAVGQELLTATSQHNSVLQGSKDVSSSSLQGAVLGCNAVLRVSSHNLCHFLLSTSSLHSRAGNSQSCEHRREVGLWGTPLSL
jgi:hypothetical protein